jgi:putative FmdB family regulatory protein
MQVGLFFFIPHWDDKSVKACAVTVHAAQCFGLAWRCDILLCLFVGRRLPALRLPDCNKSSAFHVIDLRLRRLYPMPIYEYRCEDCGQVKEHLQKLSDAPIAECPACGGSHYTKLLSAGGFQLKGSGWYATDFKHSQKKPELPPCAASGCGGGCAA